MNTNTDNSNHISTIMIVDDDDNWSFITKILLTKAGYEKEVVAANNGLQALQILKQMQSRGNKIPEVIFLDIKMPVMDGFGLLQEITQSPEFDLNKTKIYICSSSFNYNDRERAKNYPIAGFITKPLTIPVLKDILAT